MAKRCIEFALAKKKIRIMPREGPRYMDPPPPPFTLPLPRWNNSAQSHLYKMHTTKLSYSSKAQMNTRSELIGCYSKSLYAHNSRTICQIDVILTVLVSYFPPLKINFQLYLKKSLQKFSFFPGHPSKY